jgi:hypothetical protein
MERSDGRICPPAVFRECVSLSNGPPNLSPSHLSSRDEDSVPENSRYSPPHTNELTDIELDKGSVCNFENNGGSLANGAE